MTPNPSMRASDADRDGVVAALREHCAAGRLTLAEFTERLDAAYAARTLGELAVLTADLPEPEAAPYQLPAPAGRPSVPSRRRGQGAVLPSAYLTVCALCTLVWLLTGHGSSFWPIWVIGPWGVVLLVRALTGPRR